MIKITAHGIIPTMRAVNLNAMNDEEPSYMNESRPIIFTSL